MNPITGEVYRPKATALHPGVETDAEIRSDQATIKLMKGRGFVLTFSSHFAVAVIVGVIGWVYAQSKHDGAATPPAVEQGIADLSRRVTSLEASTTQWHNEETLHNQQADTQMSLLVVRTDLLLRK